MPKPHLPPATVRRRVPLPLRFVDAYALQDVGLDTYDANVALGCTSLPGTRATLPPKPVAGSMCCPPGSSRR
jgi:hypothetical protein